MQPLDVIQKEISAPIAGSSDLNDEKQDRLENVPDEKLISFCAELPNDLQASMISFIERYPNWDQYRLIKAALAGFLVQNGTKSREITRLYVGNMFSTKSMI